MWVSVCVCPSCGLCQNLACPCVCLSPSPPSSPSSRCIWLHLAQLLALLPAFQRSLIEFLFVSHSGCVCVCVCVCACVCLGPLLHSFSFWSLQSFALCVSPRVSLCIMSVPASGSRLSEALVWVGSHPQPLSQTLHLSAHLSFHQQHVLALSRICLSVCPVSSFPPPPLILTHSRGELTPCSQCWHLPAFRVFKIMIHLPKQ